MSISWNVEEMLEKLEREHSRSVNVVFLHDTLQELKEARSRIQFLERNRDFWRNRSGSLERTNTRLFNKIDKLTPKKKANDKKA